MATMKQMIPLLSIVLLLSPLANAQHDQPGGLHHGDPNSFANLMGKSMEVMDRGMMAAPMTGNPDHDFASMMMPHHQGAIDMAKAELLHGNDPVMRRLAQEILATQSQEIALMKRRLAQIAEPTKSVNRSTVEKVGPSMAGGDRVYTADQISNTISVIDPSLNKLLGVIRLGEPVPASLSPLYKGELLVHGLGFSPDGRTLAAVSIGSNSVTVIDTATNQIRGRIYVGRSPHEAFFTPDGKELWVAIRGEDYVSVIDPMRMVETRRITTANGPAMILFGPDAKYAFVPSSFVPELCVVDVQKHEVIAKIKQFSPFSPNLAVSRDGKEVWFTLKDSGKTQVISATAPFETLATLDTGPISNHVTMVDNPKGHFAYVSVGGLNVIKVYRRGTVPTLISTIPTGDLPHGIWSSPDGTRVYVGLENGGVVQAIDTTTDKVIATIPVGQLPQALVYVSNAVPSGEGIANLVPLGLSGMATHLNLVAFGMSKASGNVVVNSLGLIDSLQIAVSGLKPGDEYELQLVDSLSSPFGSRLSLVRFKANPAGAALAQALGPIRESVTSDTTPTSRRYLLVVETRTGSIILVQHTS